LVILVVLGIAPLMAGRRENGRALIIMAAAVVVLASALGALAHVYSQLQTKYGVGAGRPVIEPGSSDFWRRLGDAWSGSSVVLAGIALAVAALAGLAVLVM